MDKVIKKISEIESAAAAIMDDAYARKKTLAAESEQKIADFDRQLDAQTEQKLHDLRTQMEQEMNAQLSRQKSQAEDLIRRMEQNYETHHKQYTRALFRALVEE